MATIGLEDVRKHFGDFQAVKGSNFTVPDGTFFVLLGPSGCGKTTSLRMVAGLEMPSSGRILLDERDVTHARAGDRDIAFVFQHYALYPYMNVRANLAFPLKTQGVPRRERDQRVLEVARLLRLEDRLDSPVSRLFGGDRQRVALGRAIVRRPAAFLMDEPLGALDAELREHMRGELRQLHDRIGSTTVMVTHDQIEAMAMADLVAVMNQGEVLQIGSPLTLYRRPANLFVAGFVGSPPINRFELPGPIASGADAVEIDGHRLAIRPTTSGSEAPQLAAAIRPEYVRLVDEGVLHARVSTAEYMGTHHLLTVETALGRLRVRASNKRRLAAGETVGLDFEGSELLLFDPDKGSALQATDAL